MYKIIYTIYYFLLQKKIQFGKTPQTNCQTRSAQTVQTKIDAQGTSEYELLTESDPFSDEEGSPKKKHSFAHPWACKLVMRSKPYASSNIKLTQPAS